MNPNLTQNFTYIDQLGSKICLPKIPERIISVVPSQTELLFDLGLHERIFGITKFCIHPENFIKNYKKIGGTKKLNIEAIRRLNPDLIIANKEENDHGQINELKRFCPVWTSDIKNLDDAIQMILSLGQMCNTEFQSKRIIQSILANRDQFHQDTIDSTKIKVVYLIWKKPYMTVGGDTFIHDMLKEAGFDNCFKTNKRYPVVTYDEILEVQPDVIFFSSEPYPFKESERQIFKENKSYLVDGQYFSWYGSRLIKSFSYFRILNSMIQMPYQ